jgi:hypothetical protein
MALFLISPISEASMKAYVFDYSWQQQFWGEVEFGRQLSRKLSSIVSDHPGYLTEVEDPNSIDTPIALFVPRVAREHQADVEVDIFDRRLKKEFQERYEQAFGRTSVEQIMNVSNDQGYYHQTLGFNGSIHEANEKQKDLGNFILRRFTEHNIDSYMRTSKRTKSVWELKEKISRVEVQVAPGVKLNSNYSLSGNYFDMKFENNYLKTRALINMDTAVVGPSKVETTTIFLGKQLTRSFKLETNYIIEEKIWKIIAAKTLRNGIHLTLTGSPDLDEKTVREEDDFIMGGFAMSF